MRINRWLALVVSLVLFISTVSTAAAEVLRLPENLRIISEHAFEGDVNLDKVVLGPNVGRIDSCAFADSSLTAINLPASLYSIADDAFDGTDDVKYTPESNYTWQWLKSHHKILCFSDDDSYDLDATLGIFEPDEDNGLSCDWFVNYYSIWDSETFRNKLSGAPEWIVTQLEGPETFFEICPVDGGIAASFNITPPDQSCDCRYEVKCIWDDMEVCGYVNARFVYVFTTPDGLDIADDIELNFNHDNAISVEFSPGEFSLGYNDRAWLEDYNGDAEIWNEGSSLHIIPHSSGDFTGTIYRWTGNICVAKPINIHVNADVEDMDVQIEPVSTDCYHITWNPVSGVDEYTVYAFRDENGHDLEKKMLVGDNEVDFYTDVSTQYWYSVAYEQNGMWYYSAKATVEPIETLPEPTNLKAFLTDDGHVELFWDPVDGADGYRVYSSVTSSIWESANDYFSIENRPENGHFDELWIDYGETLYVWVCANNGDRPNKLTFAQITRADNRTLTEFFDSIDDLGQLDSLYVTGIDFSPISLVGVSNPEEQANIISYNEMLPELQASVDKYNASLDEMYGQMAAALEDINLRSIDLTDLQLSIDSDLVTFDCSAEVLDLLDSDYEVLESEIIDEYTTQWILQKDGATYCLQQTLNGVQLIEKTEVIVKKSVVSKDKPVLDLDHFQLRDGTIQTIQSFLTAVNGCEIAAEGMVDTIEKLPEMTKLNLQGLLDMKDFLKYFWKGAQGVLNIVGLGTGITDWNNNLASLNQINSIAGHGHPTKIEETDPDSLEAASQLAEAINEARNAYRLDQLSNLVDITTSTALLCGFIATGGEILVLVPAAKKLPSLAAKISAKLDSRLGKKLLFGNSLLGLNLNSRFDEAVERVRRIDSELHYSIYGVVKNNNNQPISDVQVTCGSAQSKTNENGYFEMEVTRSLVKVSFAKDGYVGIDEMSVYIKAYEPRLVNVTMTPKPLDEYAVISGFVTDKDTGLPIEGALVTCDEDKTKTTGSNGYFCFSGVIAGYCHLTYEKTGYNTEDQYVDARTTTDGSIALKKVQLPELPSDTIQFVGKVIDAETNEPIPGAFLDITFETADGSEFIWRNGADTFSWEDGTITNGQYRFSTSVFPIKYTITVGRGDYSYSTVSGIAAGGQYVTLEPRLSKYVFRLYGKVYKYDQEPLSGAKVIYLDRWGSVAEDVTGPDGAYSLYIDTRDITFAAKFITPPPDPDLLSPTLPYLDYVWFSPLKIKVEMPGWFMVDEAAAKILPYGRTEVEHNVRMGGG